MDHAGRLAAQYFAAPDGKLSVGGVDVSELADRYGTPLFVYTRSVIDEKWRQLRAALPDVFSIYYSAKANPLQAVLRCLLENGAGLEIASGGEYCQALHAGCAPENIIFAGPGKTESELALVIERGIGELHIESVLEAERAAAIAQRLGKRISVSLRVNPGGEAEGGAMRMGGRPAPFGVDEETLDESLGHVLALKPLEFRGIHIFSGTQILDYEILLSQYRKGIEIARRVAATVGRPLDTIDFGGGLGVPYFSHETELDLDRLRGALQRLAAEIGRDPAFMGTRFCIEPGRYLVAESGIYICRINDIKVSRGKKYLIVDGGMNHHLAASGNLGQTIKRNYPIAVLNKISLADTETVDVVGPLCTPLDVLARGIELPAAEVGDLVGVFQSGAYARSASPMGFLSHAAPPEVWVRNGTHRLVRRRGDIQDYLRDQCLPDAN